MKWLIPFLSLLLSGIAPAANDDALHREIRKIRRAYLDVIELLPTPEEIDWYVVYNQTGYPLAVDFLIRKDAQKQWSPERLSTTEYTEAPEQIIERSILEKNVVYLAGLWTGEMDEAVREAGTEKFINNALLATDERPSNAIDYMINLLTCRPSTAAEENEFMQIFNKVSMKGDDMSAWKTVLLHILEMHDCKYK
jgi:hypothetical protein